MKKVTVFLMLLFAALLLLAGCGSKNDDMSSLPKEPTTGDELDMLATLKMSQLESYSCIETIKTKFSIDNGDYNVSTTSVLEVCEQNTPQFQTLTKSEVHTEFRKQGTVQTIYSSVKMSAGYGNGFMFRTVDYLHYFAGIKSPMTKEEYEEFDAAIKESGAIADENSAPGRSTLLKLNDGGYKAVFSDFDKDFIDKYAKELIDETTEFDTVADNLTVTVTTDENMIYRAINMEFSFSTPDNAKNTISSLSVSTEFLNIDSTFIVDYDLEKYELVEDVRLVYLAEQAVADAKKANSATLTVTRYYGDVLPEDAVGSEFYFNKKNPVVYYQKDVAGEASHVYRYYNGTLTESYFKNSETDSESVTEYKEEYAIARIKAELDLCVFNAFLVYDIRVDPDNKNTYIFEFVPSADEIVKANRYDIVPVVKITLDDNRIVTYSYTTVGSYGSKESVQIKFDFRE